MSEFAQRIKDERERIGMTQEQFAAVAGIKRNAQSKYERGKSTPTVTYLLAISSVVDVGFILTGKQQNMTLTPEESFLMHEFRKLDQRGKGAVLGAMYGYNNPMTVQIGNVHAVNSLVKITGIGQ